MLKYFLKRNINYFFSFFLIFFLVFIGSSYILSSTESNDYLNKKKNIDLGDICLVRPQYHNKEYYEEYFDSPIIDTLGTQYPSAVTNFYYHPLFLMDNDYYSQTVVMMDYDTYIWNGNPKLLEILGKKFEINNVEFSKNIGTFINKKAFADVAIVPEYYSLIVTNDNFEKICSYNNTKNSYDKLTCINGNLENLEEPNDLENSAKIYVISIVTLNFICIVIYLNYAKKNYRDLKLLKLNGYSKIYRFGFIFIIPLISIVLCFALSFPGSILFTSIYNQLIPLAANCIKFGSMAIRGIMFSLVTSLIFTFIYSLISFIAIDGDKI